MGGVNGKPNNASSAEEARRGQSIPKALRGKWPPPSGKRGCKRVSCIDATTERHISKVQRHLSRMHAKRRAEAVNAALVGQYAIAANRLGAYGVADLAPVASNAAEDGRAKNRRVELVPQ